MTDCGFPERTLGTRRRIIGHGLGVAAGLAFGAARASAQSTPIAAPGSDHRDMLVDAARLTASAAASGRIPVGFMAAEEFAQGHLPGSVQLDWPALEVIDTSDASIAAWRDRAADILAGLGISPDTDVLAYDGGTLFAARLWWVLQYLGHDDVRALDGGLAAWRQAGGEIATGDPPALAATPTAAGWPGTPRQAALAQLAGVRASLGDPGVAIVDARTPEEYAAGHIPGAVNVNYPRNARAEEPRTWLPAADLRAMYAAVGVTPDKRVIPYCTSGVRSAVTFFALRLIGFPDVGLYTGSWQEWERHPELPTATGPGPG